MDQSIRGYNRDTIYENDLYLAAELGKALLERNKELENQLTISQKNEQEQKQDIILLAKQVEILRKANDSRMRYYEEVDKGVQELEKTNKKLKEKVKTQEEQLKSANETIEKLEQSCHDLRTKLESEYANEAKRRETECLDNNATKTVGNTNNAQKSITAESPKEESPKGGVPAQGGMNEKDEVIESLKLQYSIEESRRIKLEEELEKTKESNQNLMLKVKSLYEELTKKEEITRKRVFKKESETTCAQCAGRAATAASSDLKEDEDFLEHDIDNLPRREVVRLKCGGSAYGSRESLNNLGLEAVTPTLESCGEILASAFSTQAQQPKSSATLLGELEEQYRKLVQKYELLTEMRTLRKTISTNTIVTCEEDGEADSAGTTEGKDVKLRPKSLKLSKEVQTAWRKSTCGLDFKSPTDPTDGYFESGPPEYRRLFKEIFETLKSAATQIETPSPEIR